jgi:hypothetical protein
MLGTSLLLLLLLLSLECLLLLHIAKEHNALTCMSYLAPPCCCILASSSGCGPSGCNCLARFALSALRQQTVART